MKTKKRFDCVKMKDAAQARRAKKTGGFSREQRLELYSREHEALIKRQKRLRESNPRKG